MDKEVLQHENIHQRILRSEIKKRGKRRHHVFTVTRKEFNHLDATVKILFHCYRKNIGSPSLWKAYKYLSHLRETILFNERQRLKQLSRWQRFWDRLINGRLER